MGSFQSKGSFLKGIILVAGGSAGAQAILVATSPILTRLYTPEDFGIFALYMAILSVFVVIGSLRYELAIPMAPTNIQAVHVFIASLLVLVLISLLSAAVVYFIYDFLENNLNISGNATFLFLVPISVFVIGVYNILNYWAIRTKRFPSIASAKIKQVSITVLFQALAYKYGNMGLVLGHPIGQGAGVVSLVKSIYFDIKKCNIRTSRIWWALRRYKKFPMFSTWGALFNTVGVQLPPVLFAALFNPAVVGIYALTHRVLALPMSIIGNAVADVFLSDAAKAHREQQVSKLVSNVQKNLSAIAMPPMLILLLTGPELFSAIFGGRWEQAGEFAQWMVPWLYVVFITSPTSVLLEVLEKQHLAVVFQIVLLVVRISSIYCGAIYGDVYFTVALFSIASMICWIVLMIVINFLCSNKLSDLLKQFVSDFFVSILICSPIIIGFFVERNFVFEFTFLSSGLLVLLRYFHLYKNRSTT